MAQALALRDLRIAYERPPRRGHLPRHTPDSTTDEQNHRRGKSVGHQRGKPRSSAGTTRWPLTIVQRGRRVLTWHGAIIALTLRSYVIDATIHVLAVSESRPCGSKAHQPVRRLRRSSVTTLSWSSTRLRERDVDIAGAHDYIAELLRVPNST
jgi:hypothetical protein